MIWICAGGSSPAQCRPPPRPPPGTGWLAAPSPEVDLLGEADPPARILPRPPAPSLLLVALVGWKFSDVLQASWAGPGWSRLTCSVCAGVSHRSESAVPRGPSVRRESSGPSSGPREKYSANSRAGRLRGFPAPALESLATSPPLTGSQPLWEDETNQREESRLFSGEFL